MGKEISSEKIYVAITDVTYSILISYVPIRMQNRCHYVRQKRWFHVFILVESAQISHWSDPYLKLITLWQRYTLE